MINLQEIWAAIEGRVVALIHKTEARGCRVYNTGTQSLSSGVGTPLAFSAVLNDTEGAWSAGEPTRMYARRDGFYIAGGGWSFLTGGTAVYEVRAHIVKNSTITLCRNNRWTGQNANVYMPATSPGMFWMAAGEFVELYAYQSSGGSITVLAAGVDEGLCSAWLMRVG